MIVEGDKASALREKSEKVPLSSCAVQAEFLPTRGLHSPVPSIWKELTLAPVTTASFSSSRSQFK